MLPDGRVVSGGRDGRVLVVGQKTAQLYDPQTNQWAPAAGPHTARMNGTATLLRDGSVLVTGGLSFNPGPVYTDLAEVFTP